MGGHGTFAGTNYQAGVIAYVYCSMLALRRLDWLPPLDDTPLAVSGETGGPGDDVRVEIRDGSFEVQAKAGISGENQLREAIEDILSRRADSTDRVVLVVDRRSSGWIYREFATDMERLRRGRSDVLVKAGDLHRQFGESLELLWTKAVDVRPPDDLEAARGRDLLATLLQDPNDAGKAWSLLYQDAADLAEHRFRRNRSGLVQLLAMEGIAVRLPTADERLLAELDWIGQLLERRHAAAALSRLGELEQSIAGSTVDPSVQYFLAARRARALLQLRRPAEALSAAKVAIDVVADGGEGLIWAGKAAWMTGDLLAARRYVEGAIRAVPDDPRAWATEAQVADAAGESPAVPPDAVAASNHYRTVLAELSVANGDLESALAQTAQVLATGERPVDALFIRAWALQAGARDPADAAEVAGDVERLITEVLGGMDDVHPLKPKALVLRANAYRAIGDTDRAAEDLGLATTLDARDEDALRNLVALRLEANDDDAALELLYAPGAGADPLLLALRAQVLTRRRQREEALADLERAVTLLPDATDPDAARFAIAEAAIDLVQPDVASQSLDGLSADGQQLAIAHALRGRAAFQQGRTDDAVGEFRQAVSMIVDGRRNLLLAELGARLAREGRYEGAAEAFAEVPRGELPPDAMNSYVAVLVRLNRLARAQELIDAEANDGPLSPQLMELAVQIALAREDPDAAVVHLGALVESGHGTLSARATLAHLLIEEGRQDDAARHVAALDASTERTPVETMQLAQLLVAIGRGEEAIRVAFEAYRAARDDPRMHRALVGMVFASRIEIPPASEIGPDTYVRLRGEHGEERVHVVLAGPPIHPSENELSVDAAEAAGLLGKRVGDNVIDHPDSPWQQNTWTVEEIVPAVVHYARDAMSLYEQRFPDEPWFATAIHVGDGSKPGDFVRVIQALQERRVDVDQWLALLREQIMPLGLVAQRIGISVPELMEAAVALPDKFGPQWVEWDAPELQAWSADQARQATALILTDSSLKTMFDLQIHEVVRGKYRLVAPRSLLVGLRLQLAEARDQVEHGRSTMAAGDIPIQVDDVPAGDARLVERAARVEAVMEWVLANVVLEPRPLDSIQPEDGEPSSLREMVGRSSFDSVALSNALAIPIYADDLGLRRLGINTEERPSSVSTISLLPVLADESKLDAHSRDTQLVDLVLRNYRAVPPSVPLLLGALRRTPRLRDEELRLLFATLGSHASSPSDAAAVAATVLRSLSMGPVILIPPVRVAELALEGLAERMRRPLAAALLSRAIGDTLTFFPLELEAIRKVCARFARPKSG